MQIDAAFAANIATNVITAYLKKAIIMRIQYTYIHMFTEMCFIALDDQRGPTGWLKEEVKSKVQTLVFLTSTIWRNIEQTYVYIVLCTYTRTYVVYMYIYV